MYTLGISSLGDDSLTLSQEQLISQIHCKQFVKYLTVKYRDTSLPYLPPLP